MKLVIAMLFLPLLAWAQTDRPTTVMAFDLGKTIVDHGEFVREDNAFDQLWAIDGALEYLRELRQAGYPVILIVNVPNSWGGPLNRPVHERQQQKMLNLKKSIALSWARTPRNTAPEFDWSVFDHVEFPLSDRSRKTNCIFNGEMQPNCDLSVYTHTLYLARKLYGPKTRMIYQTENLDELAEAQLAGMLPRLVPPIGSPNFFLAIDEIDDFIPLGMSALYLLGHTIDQSSHRWGFGQIGPVN
jgi:hypothetical protein